MIWEVRLGLERVVSVHDSTYYITLVPCKSLMHHDIQKIISYHNFFFQYVRKEIKLFQLLTIFDISLKKLLLGD